jgi:FkbM family methyltransferase
VPFKLKLPRFYRKRFLQKFSLTRALFFHQHVPTVFWNGTHHKAPRRIQRLFSFWREAPELFKESEVVFRHYQGGDVLDIGAADAWYACLLAPHHPQNIVCFEPDPKYYSICLEVLSSLQSSFPETRFQAIPFACGSGEAIHFGRAYGHLSRPSESADASNLSTPTYTVDQVTEFLKLKPGFIKIDVEGFEGEVLQGADKTIRSHRPVIMIELHKFTSDWRQVRCDWEKTARSLKYEEKPIYESDAICRSLWSPANN